MTRYTARYWSGETRTFGAKHINQARIIAGSLGRSNGWVVRTVGKCA